MYKDHVLLCAMLGLLQNPFFYFYKLQVLIPPWFQTPETADTIPNHDVKTLQSPDIIK